MTDEAREAFFVKRTLLGTLKRLKRASQSTKGNGLTFLYDFCLIWGPWVSVSALIRSCLKCRDSAAPPSPCLTVASCWHLQGKPAHSPIAKFSSRKPPKMNCMWILQWYPQQSSLCPQATGWWHWSLYYCLSYNRNFPMKSLWLKFVRFTFSCFWKKCPNQPDFHSQNARTNNQNPNYTSHFQFSIQYYISITSFVPWNNLTHRSLKPISFSWF